DAEASLGSLYDDVQLTPPPAVQAATRASWNPWLSSDPARYRPIAVLIWDFQLLLATAPCVRLPTIVFEDHWARAHCWYSSYRLGSASVRAGIEPLMGLNASWPSLDPATVSHAIEPARF